MIVITGAGGFIGSHLVGRLIGDGHEVSALDIPATVPPNLSEFQGHRSFQYHRCDIRDSRTLGEFLRAPTDAVFHLASTVGVRSYVERPLETIDTIVGGTRNVVEACLRSNSRLIFLSTSEVYGKNPKVPWNEESDRVLGPSSFSRWSYSASKGLCEHLVNAVHAANGLPTTIIRPFNVYGPRQRPDFVVPAAIHRVLRGEPPLVYDSGSQTRCFTFINDIIAGLSATLGPNAVGKTFNFGNEQEHTISEVVDVVLRACGGSLRPSYVKTAQVLGDGYEDVPRRVPDSSRARELLGWVATTSLEEGVRATVDWARKNPAWLA
ncbi:MAG: NAD-dependent epimerase/dehydratase family protein [Thermoplasmata archaeon]